MSNVTVDVECEACGATGLYSGFCEAEGEAVVCVRCDGTGCSKLTYTPFKKRRGRKGIVSVKRSRGSFLATGVGGQGRAITYREFSEGKMP